MKYRKVVILGGAALAAFLLWRMYAAAKVTPVTASNADAIAAAWRSGGVNGVRAYLTSTRQGPINAAQAQAQWGLSSPDVGYLVNAGVLA